MIFKWSVIFIFLLISASASIEISFNGKGRQEISINDAQELLQRLKNRDVPYKIIKDSYDNFLIEVSASSYAQGIMFGSIFREVAGHSYDAGYSFGSWIRRKLK